MEISFGKAKCRNAHIRNFGLNSSGHSAGTATNEHETELREKKQKRRRVGREGERGGREREKQTGTILSIISRPWSPAYRRKEDVKGSLGSSCQRQRREERKRRSQKRIIKLDEEEEGL